jgi:hypothetical protein
VFSAIFDDLVTVVSGSEDLNLKQQTRAFFVKLNDLYTMLKDATLAESFWNKQISPAGTTVQDMYARGNMQGPVFNMISESHVYLDKLVTPPDGETPPDELLLYKIVTGLSDATYVKTPAPEHGDLLNALFIICILTTDGNMFKDEDLRDDGTFKAYIASNIDNIGGATGYAWALKSFVDYDDASGKLSVKAPADLATFFGDAAKKTERFMQMREFTELKNKALGLKPHTSAINIAQGLIAIHAYKTAVKGFTCEAPKDGDAVGNSAAIKCHRAMTSAKTNANPVKVGEAGRPAINLRVDATAEGNAEGPVELSPRV